jgi:hypothetical protein
LPLLAKGWIPKDEVRVCWCCWRFRKYGPTSRADWIKTLSGKACGFGAWSGKVQQRLSIWEIRTWLGEVVQSIDGTAISVNDMRVRCPICTLKDSPIKLLMRNSGVIRKEKKSRLDDMSVLYDKTRPKRSWRISRWNGIYRDQTWNLRAPHCRSDPDEVGKW